MSWAEFDDVIKAIAQVFIAVAACIAAVTVFRGMERRRDDAATHGRADLAETALADIYEAAAVLRWARTPVTHAGESRDRGAPDEDAELRRHRDAFFVPLKRLDDHAALFARLGARRHRLVAVFGAEAAALYDDLDEIHADLRLAAETILRMDPAIERESRFSPMRRFEEEVWAGHGNPDRLGARITGLVEVAEAVFRPHAAAR